MGRAKANSLDLVVENRDAAAHAAVAGHGADVAVTAFDDGGGGDGFGDGGCEGEG